MTAVEFEVLYQRNYVILFFVQICHPISGSQTVVVNSWFSTNSNSGIITQRLSNYVVHLSLSEHGISESAHHVIQSSSGLKLPSGY